MMKVVSGFSLTRETRATKVFCLNRPFENLLLTALRFSTLVNARSAAMYGRQMFVKLSVQSRTLGQQRYGCMILCQSSKGCDYPGGGTPI